MLFRGRHLFSNMQHGPSGAFVLPTPDQMDQIAITDHLGPIGVFATIIWIFVSGLCFGATRVTSNRSLQIGAWVVVVLCGVTQGVVYYQESKYYGLWGA